MFAIFSFTFPAKVKLVHGFLKKVWSSAAFSYSIWQGFKRQNFLIVIMPPEIKKKKKTIFFAYGQHSAGEYILYGAFSPWFLNFLYELFAYSLFFSWGGRDLCELTNLFFFFNNNNFHFSPIGATYWIMLEEVELWCKTHKKTFILI